MERLCARGTIDAQREIIPIEHCPLHPSAVALDRDLRQPNQQLSSESPPAPRRQHEQVLEIEATPAHKRREVVEEQREPDWRIAHVSDERLRDRVRAEQAVAQVGFRRDRFVAEALVIGELSNQVEKETDPTPCSPSAILMNLPSC